MTLEHMALTESRLVICDLNKVTTVSSIAVSMLKLPVYGKPRMHQATIA